MRIFAASLATETNSFSPIPTSRETYESTMYFRPGEHPDRGTLCTGPLWVARRRAKQEGFDLIEGSCFWAEPSGPTLQVAYESMREEILDQLVDPLGMRDRRHMTRAGDFCELRIRPNAA